MSKSFSNKVVVITGGSKGIGRATALRFASGGADVIITASRDISETEATLSEIRSYGVRAFAYPCDVSDELSVRAFFNSIREDAGCHIDILVHAAGISPNTPLDSQTSDEWSRVLQVNLIGTFLVVRAAKEYMRAYCATNEDCHGGAMVLISSSNGINSFDPISAHYDASKAGVVILTRDFAKEYAQYAIRVNSVAPGWINTSMNDSLPDEMRKTETEKIYLKRWGKPEEVASSIAFLASDDASFITGTTLLVDGGYG